LKPALKILILEDSANDADFVMQLLNDEKMNCEFRLAMNKKSFIKALSAFSPDVILSDNSLPQFDAADALKITRRLPIQIPFILVTGTISEEFAANIIMAGADDYILKDRMIRLPAAIKAAVKLRHTEKEKNETSEQLKENEEKYRTLIERVSDGFVALDLNWLFVYINKKGEELFNKPAGYLLGKNIWDEFPTISDEFPEAFERSFYKSSHLAMERQEHIHLEDYSFTLKRWIEANIYPSQTGISVYFTDITEQHTAVENLKSLEKKISEQKIQEQKKITRAIIKAQEKERNHLGQELHDNVNQILAGAKIYLSLAGKNDEKVKELVKYPMELIDNTITEIRLLTNQQVTPLKDINLKELIQSLLNNLFKNTTIKTVFVYNVINEAIDDDLKLNIYRIIQEQINNIMKHAFPKNVKVSVQASGKAINIGVTDDGKGFNTKTKRRGIGISNMINRIKSFDGDVAIESSPGNGCAVQIKIPY
jgi:PAS domain S-box-containing protein